MPHKPASTRGRHASVAPSIAHNDTADLPTFSYVRLQIHPGQEEQDEQEKGELHNPVREASAGADVPVPGPQSTDAEPHGVRRDPEARGDGRNA